MKKIILVLAISVATSSCWAFKLVNNGGDFRALEFVRLAQIVAMAFSSQTSDLPFRSADFNHAVQRTVVESVNEKLTIDGVPKDAINTHIPGAFEGAIRFNRLSWDLQADVKAKLIFVTHEYLGILDVDDQRYQISTRLIENNPRLVSERSTQSLSVVLNTNMDRLFSPSLDSSRLNIYASCSRFEAPMAPYNCMLYGNVKGQAVMMDPSDSRALFIEMSRVSKTCESERCVLDAMITCEGDLFSVQDRICVLGPRTF